MKEFKLKRHQGIVLVSVMFILSLLALCAMFAAKMQNHSQKMAINQHLAYELDMQQKAHLQKIKLSILTDLNAQIIPQNMQLIDSKLGCDSAFWDSNFLSSNVKWQAVNVNHESALFKLDSDCDIANPSNNQIHHYWILLRSNSNNVVFSQSFYHGFDISGKILTFKTAPILSLP